ncbi:effector-associated constant component EACC1 [Streptomyces sp. F-1]|uniref:effector-associated constant component EACC1 n=1 Tax=Streptomyces sp. F-1 TaxID=463642 RepID=UPI00085BE276|nr:hypothetical protein [Streptomyces sp. F-1]SFY49741.1 hypothetical protein STEPF1_02980 [Streptomyces sp. F-1]
MDVKVAVDGGRAADELRSLREWLVADPSLRGRVRLEAAPPAPGTLGSALETLSVALGPGGVATALASVLITWIRRRSGGVTLTVRRGDGASFGLKAPSVRELSPQDVTELTRRLSESLDGPGTHDSARES